MNPEYRELLMQYQDRKKMKWAGFYLSDHTAKIQKEESARKFCAPPLARMSLADIDETLYWARLKSLAVSIQKEETNLEGQYPPNITGPIQGFDELGIFIGAEKVDYDEIRHVTILDPLKWSELKS